jgi:hypothetical protein
MKDRNQIWWNVHHRWRRGPICRPLELITIFEANRFSVVAALADYTRYL